MALYASKEYLDRRGRPRRMSDLAGHDRGSENGHFRPFLFAQQLVQVDDDQQVVVDEDDACAQAVENASGVVRWRAAIIAGARWTR